MTKSDKKLQGKLQELEGMLNETLLLGPETHSHDFMSRNIKQKLAFMNKLLSAEVGSHPSQPHYLDHISKRLFALERNFHTWDSSRSVHPGQDKDKDSTSSYTESCVNDDEEALNETDLVGFEDPEKVCLDSNGEKGMVAEEEKETVELKNGSDKLVSSDYEEAEEFFEDFAGEKEVVELEGNDLEKEERRESTFGERCGARTCGVVIGMILMTFIIFMLNTSSDWFYYIEELSFEVPT